LLEFDQDPSRGKLLSGPTKNLNADADDFSGMNIPPIMRIAEARKKLWEKVQEEFFNSPFST